MVSTLTLPPSSHSHSCSLFSLSGNCHYEKSEKVGEGSTGIHPVPTGTRVSILFCQCISPSPCKKQVAHSSGVI